MPETEFTHLKFCGKCAGLLQKKSKTHYVCKDCRSERFNGPSAASGVIAFRGGQVLNFGSRNRTWQRKT